MLISAFVMLSSLGVTLSAQSHAANLAEKNPSIPATNDAVSSALDAIKSAGGYFIENRGQVTEGIRYYSTGNPSVGFRDDGVMFVIRESDEGERREILPGQIDQSLAFDQAPTVRSFSYMLRFEGAKRVVPAGVDRLPFRSNFFIGNDPVKWRIGVPNYEEVAYPDIYDGIDLSFRMSPTGLKYEYVVHAGADPSAINMNYEGIESLRIENGGVTFVTAIGRLLDSAPYSYRISGPEVDCRFGARGQTSLGFECPGWDASETLVIDPLIYSTFIGGGVSDIGTKIAVDDLRDAYVTGRTLSTDFPSTPGSFTTTKHAMDDIFVSKLSAAGDALLYSTFIGGRGDDEAMGIAVDPSCNTYLTGQTNSTDFPTTVGAFDTLLDGDNAPAAFVTKLNAAGDALVYSTFLEGSGGEVGTAIAVDSSGHAYVTGLTSSLDFPTTIAAFDRSYNGQPTPPFFSDVFVTKFSPEGDSLNYSTYIGGTLDDYADSIALDSAGNAYIAGITDSSNFPVTPSAFDPTSNVRPCGSWYCSDAFVTELSALGSGLWFSTYLGGLGSDWATSVHLDSAGDIYVTGETESTDFPTTPGAFRGTLNGISDAFVTKLNSTGSWLAYSTYLGGSDEEAGASITVDAQGYAYLAGFTLSTDFPLTPDATYPTAHGWYDIFLTKMNPSGGSLTYSTYIGGSEYDSGSSASVVVQDPGFAFVAGTTNSTDFPTTPGAFDTSLNGGFDVFVLNFSFAAANPPRAPYPLCIHGLCSDSIDSRMYHDTILAGFSLSWTHGDPDGDMQTQAEIALSTLPDRGAVFWSRTVNGQAASFAYDGPPLAHCSDYWFSAGTKDASLFGPYAELRFHTNCLPTAPAHAAPADGTLTDSLIPKSVSI